jgi:hypothetical protein
MQGDVRSWRRTIICFTPMRELHAPIPPHLKLYVCISFPFEVFCPCTRELYAMQKFQSENIAIISVLSYTRPEILCINGVAGGDFNDSDQFFGVPIGRLYIDSRPLSVTIPWGGWGGEDYVIGGPSDETTPADAKLSARLPSCDLAVRPWDIWSHLCCH